MEKGSTIKKRLLWLVLVFLILFPIILFILPKTHFDSGPTTCIYTLITGENCLGCGMTRACMRLIHFDFRGAWEFNAMSFIVFPILAFFYGKYFLTTFYMLIKKESTQL